MKKFVAMMMTLAMVLALAVPVLATAPTPTPISSTASSAGASSGSGYSAEYEGKTNVPTLDVDVKFWTDTGGESDKGRLVLNPFQLEVEKGKDAESVDSAGVPSKQDKTNAQVIATPVYIDNKSNATVGVVIAKGAEAQTSGNVKLVSKAVDNSKAATDLNVFLLIYGELSTVTTPRNDWTVDKTKDVVLDQATSKAVKVLELKSKEQGYVRIGGNCAWNLSLDADNPWTSSDKVDKVTYEMKIMPVVTSSSST